MNRKSAWEKIWAKKYKSFQDHEFLHVAAGYDGLSLNEWKRLTHFFIDKLDFQIDDHVLEVGCGCGAFLKELEGSVASMSGVDYSQDAISRIKLEMPGEFKVSEADKLNFDDSKFDVIISFGVFFYFEKFEYATSVLDEMLRTLKPGGKIFIGEVSDLAKKELAEKLRDNSSDSRENHRISKINADHLYFPQSFFSDYAKNKNLSFSLIRQDVKDLDFYYNSKYRFSIILSDGDDLSS